MIADFTLTAADGKPFASSSLQGAPTLVFFGFSHCPTVCPAALTQLRQLQVQHAAALGPARIVIISVDGERDGAGRMAEWLGPISPAFIGLTGPSETVREIAAAFSAAFFKVPGRSPDDYLVEHNAQIFLLDQRGRLHASFFNASVDTMASVVAELNKASVSAREIARESPGSPRDTRRIKHGYADSVFCPPGPRGPIWPATTAKNRQHSDREDT